MAPTATLRIDLSQSFDQILARMTSSKRYEVRRIQRAGLEFRAGERSELTLFHALHSATGAHQKFQGMSLSYLEHHWDALDARGATHLIFAYHQGRALAAIWLTAFGGIVTQRLTGWNRDGRRLQPNLACRWEAIRWAKERGYSSYDLGGIDRRYAEMMVAGHPLPDEFHKSFSA